MDIQKRKRLESRPDPPSKRFTMPPALSPSEFVEVLAECASALKIEDSLHVSLADLTISGKDIADHLASLAWKATGYQFR